MTSARGGASSSGPTTLLGEMHGGYFGLDDLNCTVDIVGFSGSTIGRLRTNPD